MRKVVAHEIYQSIAKWGYINDYLIIFALDIYYLSNVGVNLDYLETHT